MCYRIAGYNGFLTNLYSYLSIPMSFIYTQEQVGMIGVPKSTKAPATNIYCVTKSSG